jgi:coproporphyrinogen III oxidase
MGKSFMLELLLKSGFPRHGCTSVTYRPALHVRASTRLGRAQHACRIVVVCPENAHVPAWFRSRRFRQTINRSKQSVLAFKGGLDML